MKTATKSPRWKTIAYWVMTILGPASFLYGGILQLTRAPEVASALAHLGYPLYFAVILGVWKILGVAVILAPRLPRLKEWAYAGFFFDLTAAAASHAFVHDKAADVIAPLVCLALVMASWALRPASRKVGFVPQAAAQTPVLRPEALAA